jgi:hypothetical protein
MKGRVGTALRYHGYCYHSVNEAVLKLGDATLFRVSKYFFKSRQSLPGLLSDHLPIFIAFWSILELQNFENILKRVAMQKG